MLKGEVYIKEQEVSGNYIFTGVEMYMTCGFKETFEEEAAEVAFVALNLILERYPKNADYLQVFEYHREDEKIVRFWCINDVDHITFLLPEDY